MIDWQGALEAVHTDGRVAAVTPTGIIDVPNMKYAGYVDKVGKVGFDKNGFALPSFNNGHGWAIRNAQPAWRTSAEQLDRMDALLHRIVNGKVDKSQTPLSVAINTEILAEARAILDTREPVDPRFEKARCAITEGMPLLADSTVRRLTRDVLAALDAVN